jgi:hypothetical protein
MNTNETKAKIWNMCIEKGIFNKIKGDDFKKIQEIFEKIIKGYEQVEPSQEVFNKIMDSISFEIYNQTQGQTQNQIENKIVSYETIQKEYDELLNTPIPKQIDFTTVKIHTPRQDLGLQEALGQVPQRLENQNEKIRLEEIIMTQNKILIQILETQVKMLGLLKK